MAYAGSPAGAVVSRGAGSGVVVAAASPRAVSIRTVRATAPIARRVTLFVVAHPDGRHVVIEPTQLGDYEGLGFSLKSVVKGIGKVASNVGKTVVKAAKDTGHVVGSAATSTVGKAILAGGLALTGVGIPAAAGIMAATQAGGNLIKPGGNVGKAAKGAVEGAAEGAAASVVGSGLKKFAPSVVTGARKVFNKVTPGDTFKTDAQGGTLKPTRKTAVVGKVLGATTKGTPLKFKKVPDLVHGEKPDVPAAMVETAVAALPVVKALPETTGDIAKTDDKKKGDDKKAPVKRTRIAALVDKAKKAAEAVQQQTTQVEPYSQPTAPPIVYNPGTGPLAQETAPQPTPSADKPALPLPLILGGAAVLLLAMNRK